MKTASLLSFEKFCALSKLPDRAIVWLLCHHQLPCVISSTGELEVDVSRLSIDTLKKSLHHASVTNESQNNLILTEQLRSLVLKSLDGIVEKALDRLEQSPRESNSEDADDGQD